jgi:hypothetical protein
MFKKMLRLIILFIILLVPLTGCQNCLTHNGYGRYALKAGCGKVVIDGATYEITQNGSELVIEGHTISRGIYRKTRPWLYVHQIEGGVVDLTFDEGSKDIYPLYTGASASVFDVYAHPWEITRSTNFSFSNNYWLVAHRWSDAGIYFDLHQNVGDQTQWVLVQGDIFVAGNGAVTTIPEINSTVKINDFDAVQRKAMVEFSEG